MEKTKTVFVIAGPTASGKSTRALQSARAQGGVIINADSMQLYGALRILTARPCDQDLAQCPHKLYGIIENPNDFQSVAAWRQRAICEIESAFALGHVPMIVGGTGLYLKALLEGLSPIPKGDPQIRETLRAQAADHTKPYELYHLLEREDPESARHLNPTDTQRIVRALEVIRSTGYPIGYWQQKKGEALPYQTHKILLAPPRERLVLSAEKRLRHMFDMGAIDEVKAFLALGIKREAPLYKAVGVREISAYLTGQITLEEAFDKALIATRQYIKRQQTWFRTQMHFDEIIEASVSC